MSDTPIDDAAKTESVRLQGIFKRFVCLPVPFVCWCFGRLKRLFVTRPSPTERRATDKQHQAEVRRELRGLPPVHDGGRPVP